MNTRGLTNAAIINLDSPGQIIRCLFNPKEYTITKQNRITQGSTSGSSMSKSEFSTGQPATLKVQLFFDTYDTRQDVRVTYTDKIWNLMMTSIPVEDNKTKRSRPPKVQFRWGSYQFYDSHITQISQKFTLFLDDGTPVRATVDVTFQQILDPAEQPAQNPTSGGEGGERVWTVSAGDTLPLIAYRSYGDSTMWRIIADANGLDQVRNLPVGIELVIPNA